MTKLVVSTGAGSGGFVYDDLASEVTGNVRNPVYVATDEVNISLVNEATGAAPTYYSVAATGTTLAQMVIDINGAGAAAADLIASDAGGYLKLESANGLTIGIVEFTPAGGANDIGTHKSGLDFGDNRSKRNEVAEKVKAEALDYFDTNRRELNL